MRLIETERLTLRDFAAADWDAVNAMLAGFETTRYMHFSTWSLEQRRKWFAWCLANSQEALPDAANWAIVLRATGEVIGWFGIGSTSEPVVEHARSFGYVLARDMWGRGYMTEALGALALYEFDTLGTPYIEATCETTNPASARVMEKAGMQRLKTVRDTDFEGNWAERHHYGMSNPRR